MEGDSVDEDHNQFPLAISLFCSTALPIHSHQGTKRPYIWVVLETMKPISAPATFQESIYKTNELLELCSC